MTRAWTKPLTRKGFYKIAEEHRHLLEEVRPGVVQGIATAAAEGDRSENAEYIYGKKRLREIDKRLRYLSSLLKDAEVVDPAFLRSDQVEFGAIVTLEGEDQCEKVWQIVGMGEADANEGSISWQSPLAKALLGKKVGDEVELRLPDREVFYVIKAIQFEQS